MNMQSNLKGRRTNNISQSIGEHMTLTKCENDEASGRVYGFAVMDNGEKVFIPATVIKVYSIQPHDIGAGFTAPMVPNPRATDHENTVKHMVTLPVQWDGDQTDVVDEHDTGRTCDERDTDAILDAHEIEQEFVKLAEACDEFFVNIGSEISAAITQAKNLDLKSAMEAMEKASELVTMARDHIDTAAPDSE